MQAPGQGVADDVCLEGVYGLPGMPHRSQPAIGSATTSTTIIVEFVAVARGSGLILFYQHPV